MLIFSMLHVITDRGIKYISVNLLYVHMTRNTSNVNLHMSKYTFAPGLIRGKFRSLANILRCVFAFTYPCSTIFKPIM